MKSYSTIINVMGRILLSVIFIMAGLSKLGDGYAGTQAYMSAMGVPAELLPVVIVTELGVGVTLLIGLFTRVSALLLAGFTLLAAIIFHADFSDQMQSILFMKNLAIAGGLFMVMSVGGNKLSLDYLFNRNE